MMLKRLQTTLINTKAANFMKMLLVFIGLLLSLTGCEREQKILMKEDLKRPQYVAPLAKTKLWEDAYASLRKGMSQTEVVAIFGKPDADNVLESKEGVFVTRAVYYYLERWESGFVNEQKDKYVRLEFDKTGRLVAFSFKR